MKTTASFFISFIYLLASFTADALEYTSSASTVSEVVPGPGLPSLESLGLTSADLHMANDDTNTSNPLEKRFKLMCKSNGGGRVPVSDAQACMNYLSKLGHRACDVKTNRKFCTSGEAIVTGANIRGSGTESSYCSDVALGGQKIINKCNQGGKVAGANAANGNGMLAVAIENKDTWG